jgi:hypothetical protein
MKADATAPMVDILSFGLQVPNGQIKSIKLEAMHNTKVFGFRRSTSFFALAMFCTR